VPRSASRRRNASRAFITIPARTTRLWLAATIARISARRARPAAV